MNGYDHSFLRWMRRYGVSVHDFLGKITIYAGDKSCPFRIRSSDLERYEDAGFMERFYPQHRADAWQGLWDEFYRLTEKPIPE